VTATRIELSLPAAHALVAAKVVEQGARSLARFADLLDRQGCESGDIRAQHGALLAVARRLRAAADADPDPATAAGRD